MNRKDVPGLEQDDLDRANQALGRLWGMAEQSPLGLKRPDDVRSDMETVGKVLTWARQMRYQEHEK